LEDSSVSGFSPIPELNRTDADINLLILLQGQGVQYSTPVDDPWFEAKSPKLVSYEYQPGESKNETVYNPQLPISTVGCAMQTQWCSNSGDNSKAMCTDLTGIVPSIRQARHLFTSEKQKVTLERMIQTVKEVGDFSKMILSIPGSFLLMNKYGYYRVAAPADDQWIQELDHLFGMMLTSMQIRNCRFAGGYQSALDIKPIIRTPSVNETWMCDAQIVRRQDYQSLSVLGLALICSIGGVIILINLTIDSIVGWYQKRYNKRGYAMQEWHILQAEALQRQLYLSQGFDLREQCVSIAEVLDGIKIWKNNETMVTLVEKNCEIGSMSSVEMTEGRQSKDKENERGTGKSAITSHSFV
jgi:hypothetical protein